MKLVHWPRRISILEMTARYLIASKSCTSHSDSNQKLILHSTSHPISFSPHLTLRHLVLRNSLDDRHMTGEGYRFHDLIRRAYASSAKVFLRHQSADRRRCHVSSLLYKKCSQAQISNTKTWTSWRLKQSWNPLRDHFFPVNSVRRQEWSCGYWKRSRISNICCTISLLTGMRNQKDGEPTHQLLHDR